MPLEFNSISNLASSLGRKRFQRLNRFAFSFSRFSQGMRVAINRNGMTTRDFNREMSVRVQAVKVPDQNIFTSDVVGPGGFDYEHPYQYSLQKDVTISVLSQQFERLRSVFVDWMRVSSGIGSNGALPYRTDVSCDLSVVVLSDTGIPLMGHEIKDVIIKGVTGNEFRTDSNDLAKFDVSLSCRRLRRLSGIESNIALSGLSF